MIKIPCVLSLVRKAKRSVIVPRNSTFRILICVICISILMAYGVIVI